MVFPWLIELELCCFRNAILLILEPVKCRDATHRFKEQLIYDRSVNHRVLRSTPTTIYFLFTWQELFKGQSTYA